jgi:hypothetical protein
VPRRLACGAAWRVEEPEFKAGRPEFAGGRIPRARQGALEPSSSPAPRCAARGPPQRFQAAAGSSSSSKTLIGARWSSGGVIVPAEVAVDHLEGDEAEFFFDFRVKRGARRDEAGHVLRLRVVGGTAPPQPGRGARCRAPQRAGVRRAGGVRCSPVPARPFARWRGRCASGAPEAASRRTPARVQGDAGGQPDRRAARGQQRRGEWPAGFVTCGEVPISSPVRMRRSTGAEPG